MWRNALLKVAKMAQKNKQEEIGERNRCGWAEEKASCGEEGRTLMQSDGAAASPTPC